MISRAKILLFCFKMFIIKKLIGKNTLIYNINCEEIMLDNERLIIREAKIKGNSIFSECNIEKGIEESGTGYSYWHKTNIGGG